MSDSNLPKGPYPSTTKAKGWRFEIDLEQVMQSDTWALAPSEIRPWLLMLWTTAWQQTPCGSMPSEDALIVARLGINPKVFAKYKTLLLRGWWLADDARLYHNTIAARVLDMLAVKDKERQRKANYRARMEGGRTPADANGKADLSHGTPVGLPPDYRGSDPGGDDTGTGTGTGTGLEIQDKRALELQSAEAGKQSPPPLPAEIQVGKAGAACKAMRAAGLQDASPSHPTLIALLESGVTVDELRDAAATAHGKSKGFTYALAVAEGRRRDAAAVADIPTAPFDAESRSTIEAEGVAKGIGPWDELSEHWPAYKARVRGPAQKGFAPSIVGLVTGALRKEAA